MAGLTQQLAGRVIENVTRNGVSIVIRCSDGLELQVGWADPKTGQPVEGVPVVVRQGVVAQAPRGVHLQVDLSKVRQDITRQIGR